MIAEHSLKNNLQENKGYWFQSQPEGSIASPKLTKDVATDVAIIGGGFGGLFCAFRLLQQDVSVTLLEEAVCGAGATGKSGGFLVPDPEIYPALLIREYEENGARKIWEFGLFGVKLVSETAQKLAIDCSLTPTDSLYLANNGSIEMVTQELAARKTLEGDNFRGEPLNQDQLRDYIGSTKYTGGARFEGTFRLNPYKYCQGLKDALLTNPNFHVYESTQAEQVKDHEIYTPQGKVKADKIVFCSDRSALEFTNKKKHLPSVQTFVLMSESLPEEAQKQIFPCPNVTMAWDTELVYNYFRLTNEGRLLLGGGDALSVYASGESSSQNRVLRKLDNYFNQNFPDINPKWEYFWGGKMAVVDDLIGLVGQVGENYYINAAATGLSMAAAGGFHLAELITDNGGKDKNLIPPQLSPNRELFSLGIARIPFGSQLPVACSHFLRSMVW